MKNALGSRKGMYIWINWLNFTYELQWLAVAYRVIPLLWIFPPCSCLPGWLLFSSCTRLQLIRPFIVKLISPANLEEKKTNKHTSQSFPKGRKERGKEVCSGPLTHPQTVLVWVSSAVLQQMPQKSWGSSVATAEGEEQSGWAVRLGRLRGHRVHCRNRHHPKNYWMILCKIAKWKVLMKNRF